uniref:Uncharacterized protein n=1 Tax=Micrurus spixii TaxID=129469 RepID=A0A2D4LLF9_9SAUR
MTKMMMMYYLYSILTYFIKMGRYLSVSNGFFPYKVFPNIFAILRQNSTYYLGKQMSPSHITILAEGKPFLTFKGLSVHSAFSLQSSSYQKPKAQKAIIHSEPK